MEEKKPIIKPQDKEILKALLEHDYWLSTTEVADKAGISWNTAKGHLEKLHKLRWIAKKRIGVKEEWKAEAEEEIKREKG
jgi:predicted transcriptional regulator